MLEGRFDNRVARFKAPLGVSLVGRLEVPTVGFRYLEFRLDRFEITVSPPYPSPALQESSKHLSADPALRLNAGPRDHSRMRLTDRSWLKVCTR
jgi:hypothetical protein